MKLEEYLADENNSRDIFDISEAVGIPPLAVIKRCQEMGLAPVILGQLSV